MRGFGSVFDEFDAFLFRGTGDDPDFQYLADFDVGDPCYVLRTPDETVLFVAALEVGLARANAAVDRVVSYNDFVDADARGDLDAESRALVGFLEAEGGDRIAVPPAFPVRIARNLADAGVAVEVRNAVAGDRLVKDDEELDALRAAQAATEAAMERVRNGLAAASVDDEGRLVDGSEVITSERVREWIDDVVTGRGAVEFEATVACGPASADPHQRGTGPIRASETLVVDIFPKFASGYYGDMTRTFVKGEPSPEAERFHGVVHEALNAALGTVRAGVTGEAVDAAALEVIEAAGYPTLRTGAETRGMVHGTGHALGVDLHEQPRLTAGVGELPAGSVFTVEPGLYDPDVGGVRLEDMVVVTEDGHENLNEMDYRLVV